MDLDQILAPGAGSANPASRPIAYSGTVSRLDGVGAAFVVVPALSLDYEHGPVKLLAGAVPAEGQDCLVIFDESNTPWALLSA